MRAWWLAVVLLMAPLAQAGTVDDPEITDPENDHTLVGGQEDSENLIKSVDIIKGWVEAVTDEHVDLRVQTSQQMRGGSVEGNPTTQYQYDYHFTVNGQAHRAGGHVVGPAPPTVTANGVASEAFIDPASDRTLVLIVPLEAIGGLAAGEAIAEMYIDSQVYAEDVTIGTDRAPDAGHGRDFVVPAGDTVQYIDVGELPITNETRDPATGVVQYNWTGATSLHLHVQADAGNVSLNISVQDTSVFAWNGTHLNQTLPQTMFPDLCVDAEIMPQDCTFAFRFTLDGFVGAYRIEAGQYGNETVPDDGAPHGNATDNETGAPPGAEQESPSIALPMLAVGLLVAVWRRR